MFTISFEYNGVRHKALVSPKDTVHKHYRITIMNGGLEKLLHGKNVVNIDEELPEIETSCSETEKLLFQIKRSLKKHLHVDAVS